MSKTLFGEIEAKGLARGLAEGEARGKAEAVVTFLKARFGELPMKTSDRVLKISDLVVLDSLTQLAATCDSLDTFAKALD